MIPRIASNYLCLFAYLLRWIFQSAPFCKVPPDTMQTVRWYHFILRFKIAQNARKIHKNILFVQKASFVCCF